MRLRVRRPLRLARAAGSPPTRRRRRPGTRRPPRAREAGANASSRAQTLAPCSRPRRPAPAINARPPGSASRVRRGGPARRTGRYRPRSSSVPTWSGRDTASTQPSRTAREEVRLRLDRRRPGRVAGQVEERAETAGRVGERPSARRRGGSRRRCRAPPPRRAGRAPPPARRRAPRGRETPRTASPRSAARSDPWEWGTGRSPSPADAPNPSAACRSAGPSGDQVPLLNLISCCWEIGKKSFFPVFVTTPGSRNGFDLSFMFRTAFIRLSRVGFGPAAFNAWMKV